ncbi:MAG TPA: BsuPI-related putative proteinase inhibitor [Actinomycetota bacterium]|nr:BsuPI-related putative proteinase inhibitor [Actinomycetota bacterium]
MKARTLVAVAALAFCSCASSGAPVGGDQRRVGSVTVTLRVDPSRVKLGRSVRLTLGLQNVSGQAQTLRFASGQKYDFWATRDGREVWRWSKDRVFTQAEQSQELQGQTGAHFSESWTPGQAGTYEVMAEFAAEGFAGTLRDELVVE